MRRVTLMSRISVRPNPRDTISASEAGSVNGREVWTPRGKQLLKLLLFVLLFIVPQETFHRFLHAINLRQLMTGRPEALLLFVIDAFHFAAVLLATVAAALRGVAFLAVGFFEEPRTANWRQMSVYFRDLDENLIKVAYYA